MLTTLFLSFALGASQQSALYKSLDPQSIDAHIAYFQLFPTTREGQLAQVRAWKMLGADCSHGALPSLSADTLNQIKDFKPATSFDEKTRALIETLAAHLPNRTLKGHFVLRTEDLLALDPADVEISRGLLLQEGTANSSYEAVLDLLALKALAKIRDKGGLSAKPEEKIEAINQLIFFDMAMRYPPLSLSEEHIDSYSSLAAVLDSTRGVCLGTSFVYLALAERMGLTLEIITPPGHIYVRGRDSLGRMINIETTARGVDIADRHYQSINVKCLKKRTRLEALGLLAMNEASVYIRQKEWARAVLSYERAEIFIKDDATLTQLKGICLALQGRKKEAERCLTKALSLIDETQIDQLTLATDFINRAVDAETLLLFFEEAKPVRSELLAKEKLLVKALKRCPRFREGLLELADIYLKLNRPKEAIHTLKRYHALDGGRLQVEYMLGVLLLQRSSFEEAKEHLDRAKLLLDKHGQKSREFDAAYQALSSCYTPSPIKSF